MFLVQGKASENAKGEKHLNILRLIWSKSLSLTHYIRNEQISEWSIGSTLVVGRRGYFKKGKFLYFASCSLTTQSDSTEVKDQGQIIMDQPLAKAKPRFDTIPEDTVLEIVKFIQEWAIVDGSVEQREKGRRWVIVGRPLCIQWIPLFDLSCWREEITSILLSLFPRARDSALRAISLSCRNRFNIQPILLTNINLLMKDFCSFHQFLERNPASGKLIRSFRLSEFGFENLSDEDQISIFNAVSSFSTLPISSDPIERINDGLSLMSIGVYQRLSQLQSLIISFQEGFPAFQFSNENRWKNDNSSLIQLP